MYDVKKLPFPQMNEHFKKALESISRSIARTHRTNKFDAESMQEHIEKIIRHMDKLPAGEATEMLEGLADLVNIAAARIREADILTWYMANPDFVPSEALAKIVDHPLLHESCNLPECLIPCVPKHLLSEKHRVED